MAIHKMVHTGKQRISWMQYLLAILVCAAPHLQSTTAQVTELTTITDIGSLTNESDVTEIVASRPPASTQTDIRPSPNEESVTSRPPASTQSDIGPSPDEEAGKDREIIDIRFTLINYNVVDQELENKIVEEMDTALYPVGQVKFENFSPSSDMSERVFLDVIIEENSDSARVEVLNITYYLVSIGGSIAGLPVRDLEIKSDSGEWMSLTFCSIKHRGGCPDGMACKDLIDDELCTAVCAANEDYCKYAGKCQDGDSDFITCSCQEGFTGERCEIREALISDNLRYVLIAIAGLLALIVLLILLCCLMRLCRSKRKSNRGLYGVENVVALHSLHEESDGIAIQTDDSFLLKLSHENGVPPKPGYTHTIMQTNESFLLARSQNPKIAQVEAQPQQSAKSAGNGVGVDSTSTAVNNNPSPSPAKDSLKSNSSSTAQTGGSLARNIVTV